MLAHLKVLDEIKHIVTCFAIVDEGIRVVLDLFMEVLFVLRCEVGVFFCCEEVW